MLHQNMRLQNNCVNTEYAIWLSQLSYDPALNGYIVLPNYIPWVPKVVELFDQMFPQIEMRTAYQDSEFFRGRGILTPFNAVKLDMSREVLSHMVENENHSLFGVDSAEDEDPTLQQFSVESLQNINLAGLPLSKLELRIGAPVMLLRNIDQTYRLNNGSRLVISQIGVRVIAGHLQGGDFDSQLRLIPRIPLTSLEGDLAFILCRRQFPVQ